MNKLGTKQILYNTSMINKGKKPVFKIGRAHV
jgi:hypothetical protein